MSQFPLLAKDSKVTFRSKSLTISTVNSSTESITVDESHKFRVNDPIKFTAPVPTPISTLTTYYVIESGLTATSFKFSTTVGGSAVNLTSTTTGGTVELDVGQTLSCQSVVMFQEYVGKVQEDIDFNLIEDYQEVRLGIEIQLMLTLDEVLLMQQFLRNQLKQILIPVEANSSTKQTFNVVNDSKKNTFDLTKKSNARSSVKLKFLVKEIGIPEETSGDGGGI